MPATRALAAALDYADKFGWFIFPCVWYGKNRKQPLVDKQHDRATRDRAQIVEWWTCWPHALIGVSAGLKSGVVCLDVDVKNPRQNGFDTLARIGRLPLPDTPMQHTASGGLHVLFAQGAEPIRSTTGKLGAVGKKSGGLDVRSSNNHFIAAAPGVGIFARPDPQPRHGAARPGAGGAKPARAGVRRAGQTGPPVRRSQPLCRRGDRAGLPSDPPRRERQSISDPTR